MAVQEPRRFRAIAGDQEWLGWTGMKRRGVIPPDLRHATPHDRA